jgi:hypothetical protein
LKTRVNFVGKLRVRFVDGLCGGGGLLVLSKGEELAKYTLDVKIRINIELSNGPAQTGPAP